MEYLDVVDEGGEPIGRRVSRADAHRAGLRHRAVHCWLLNSQGELLLQQRSLKKDTHPGQWDISIGGHVPAGMNPIEAVIKEAAEELGLELAEPGIQYLFSLSHQSTHHDGRYINNEFNDVYLARCDRRPEDFILQEEEVAAVAWVPIGVIKDRLAAKDPTLLPHEEYPELLRRLDDRVEGPAI